MTKKEYLAELAKRLEKLDEMERQDVIGYYEEYFADAGEEKEQEVIEGLGRPKQLAMQIKAESAYKKAEADPQDRRKRMEAVWLGIGAVFAAPVAIPVAIALAVVLIALLLVAAVVLLSFYAVSIGFGAGAVLCLFCTAISISVPSAALTVFGTALVLAGLAVLVFIPTLLLSRVCFRGIAKLANKMISGRAH